MTKQLKEKIYKIPTLDYNLPFFCVDIRSQKERKISFLLSMLHGVIEYVVVQIITLYTGMCVFLTNRML